MGKVSAAFSGVRKQKIPVEYGQQTSCSSCSSYEEFRYFLLVRVHENNGNFCQQSCHQHVYFLCISFSAQICYHDLLALPFFCRDDFPSYWPLIIDKYIQATEAHYVHLFRVLPLIPSVHFKNDNILPNRIIGSSHSSRGFYFCAFANPLKFVGAIVNVGNPCLHSGVIRLVGWASSYTGFFLL